MYMFQTYKNISIRWKFQIEMMLIVMVTTAYNQWGAANALAAMINMAKQSLLPSEEVLKLQQQYDEFISSIFLDFFFQFIIQFIIVSFIARAFVAPLLELIESLKAVEKGDLTQGVEVKSHDELGQLEEHFNKMLRQLSGVLSSVKTSSVHMSQSAFQIAEVSHEIENISLSEDLKSQEVNSATQHLYESAQQVFSYAGETTEKAKGTVEKSKSGQSSLSSSIQQMNKIADEIEQAALQINELVKATQTINTILGSIKQIAQQTNLLALNAAIEAARAGEQGRGFAVVADEVRKLASRTGQSAEEVTNIVDSLTSKVNNAETIMTKLVSEIENNQHKMNATALIIGDMQLDADQTALLNDKISGACRSQMITFEQLKQSHQSLFKTLKENGAKIANTANISDLLYSLTQGLNKQMSGLSFNQVEKVEVLNKNKEKRNCKRVKAHKLISVDSGFKKWEGLSQDISLNGIKALLQEKLPENTKLKLSIRKPHKDMAIYQQQEPLHFDVKLAWQKNTSDGKFMVGLMFENPSTAQLASIQECIDFFEIN